MAKKKPKAKTNGVSRKKAPPKAPPKAAGELPALTIKVIPQAGGRTRDPWGETSIRSVVYAVMASSDANLNRNTVAGAIIEIAERNEHLKRMIPQEDDQFLKAVGRARSSYLRELKAADGDFTKIPGYNAEALYELRIV